LPDGPQKGNVGPTMHCRFLKGALPKAGVILRRMVFVDPPHEYKIVLRNAVANEQAGLDDE